MTVQSKSLYGEQRVESDSRTDASFIRSGSFLKTNLLLSTLRGALSMSLYVINTLFWVTVLFVVVFFKSLVPNRWFRLQCSRLLNLIANTWIKFNNLNQKLTADIHWDVKGVEELNPNAWYMLVANHQSWVDILVVQRIFHKKIPFIKFFLKKELIWVPFLGLAWWALDFPFMKRYSRAFLKKHPHLKGKDLEITRNACKKFKQIPISIMTFVEGTRFNRGKHAQQKSPHRHLLRPKAGGIAFTLAAMGGQLDSLLDITIVYPQGPKRLWDFVCGRIHQIKVRVRSVPLLESVRGDYANDPEFKRKFQQWINELWIEKDSRIDYLMSGGQEMGC